MNGVLPHNTCHNTKVVYLCLKRINYPQHSVQKRICYCVQKSKVKIEKVVNVIWTE